ncbi:Dos2-interacting transcription regulator of RNA-Pol-II-domain-containing protein [Blastocladiella britannica]|nr:Dos2-interacting transcription regulator of RNA-Pol-II-domain-containing protein [Blastocladiella britannica]
MDVLTISLLDPACNDADAVARLALTVSTDALPALVASLGPALTHTDPFVRERAVLLLALVIEPAAADGRLPAPAPTVLVGFLRARLVDALCVPHIARATAALAPILPTQDLSGLLMQIFADIDVQSFPQTTRHHFYRLFDAAIVHHGSVLRTTMSAEFLQGYIAAVDGEKDPRNLALAFHTMHLLASQFSIPPAVAQDLFEVLFCYFPITFKAPPDDPSGVTAASLKVSLAACLAATPQFAPFAIPAVAEKLESANMNAKRDSLALLTAALPVYGLAAVLPHIPRLWAAIKQDVYHSADAAHEQLSLATITALVHLVAVAGAAGTGSASPVDLIVQPAVRESLAHLASPETKNARISGHLLRTLTAADPEVASTVVTAVVPVLAARLRAPDLPATHHRTLVDALALIVDGASVHARAPPPLVAHCTELYASFSVATGRGGAPARRTAGLRGLVACVSVPGLLDATREVGTYLQPVVAAASDAPQGPDDMEVAGEARGMLEFVARQSPDAALAWIVPPLVARLEAVASADDYDDDTMCAVLDSLVVLARAHPELLFAPVLHALLARDAAPGNLLAARAGLIATAIGQVVEAAPHVSEQEVLAVVSQIDAYAQPAGDSPAPVALTMAAVLGSMVSKLTPARVAVDLFARVMGQGWLNRKETHPALVALVCNLPRPLPAPLSVPETDLITQVLQSASSAEANRLDATLAAQILGSLVNKASDPNALLAAPALAQILSMRTEDQSALTELSIAVRLWTAKALAMRSHPLVASQVDWILDAMHAAATAGNTPAARQLARGVGIIVADSAGVLNKAAHAVIRPLYKQRVYHRCLPRITAGISATNPVSASRDSFMIALGHLLHSVPTQVLLGSVDQILPLLMAAISLAKDDQLRNDPALLEYALATLVLVAKSAPATLVPHVSTLVPRWLEIASNPYANPMSARMAALQCLREASAFQSTAVFPLRASILRGLSYPLDDPKRLVRRAAVDCRAAWFHQDTSL